MLTNTKIQQSRIRSFEDGLPRIFDLDLASALEFAQPRNIRNLISRHTENLSEFSVCFTVKQTPGPLGGRPSVAYYLCEEQALYIAAMCETRVAHRVRVMLIKVFAAYRRGELVSADPDLQPATPSSEDKPNHRRRTYCATRGPARFSFEPGSRESRHLADMVRNAIAVHQAGYARTQLEALVLCLENTPAPEPARPWRPEGVTVQVLLHGPAPDA